MRGSRRNGGPAATRVLFRAEPDAVRRALRGTLDGIARHRLAAEDRQVLELVLAEVLNNVVEHAYRARPEGVIELSVRIDGDAVGCAVVDRGEPMPDHALPQGRLPDPAGETTELQEGGFGWYLIRSLTRDLSYCRTSGRNRLSFAVPLGAAAGAGGRMMKTG